METASSSESTKPKLFAHYKEQSKYMRHRTPLAAVNEQVNSSMQSRSVRGTSNIQNYKAMTSRNKPKGAISRKQIDLVDTSSIDSRRKRNLVRQKSKALRPGNHQSIKKIEMSMHTFEPSADSYDKVVSPFHFQ